ncbi:aa3-type cytochrome c oxidase subunit IV [Albidovulum sp.]
MAEYKHGSMDISEHEKTFHGFIRFATRAVIVILAILVFLALANA